MARMQERSREVRGILCEGVRIETGLSHDSPEHNETGRGKQVKARMRAGRGDQSRGALGRHMPSCCISKRPTKHVAAEQMAAEHLKADNASKK